MDKYWIIITLRLIIVNAWKAIILLWNLNKKTYVLVIQLRTELTSFLLVGSLSRKSTEHMSFPLRSQLNYIYWIYQNIFHRELLCMKFRSQKEYQAMPCNFNFSILLPSPKWLWHEDSNICGLFKIVSINKMISLKIKWFSIGNAAVWWTPKINSLKKITKYILTCENMVNNITVSRSANSYHNNVFYTD